MSEFFNRAIEYTKGCKENGLLDISVLELGNLKIYYKALDALSQKEFDHVATLESKGDSNAFIDLLIVRACNEDGSKMFPDKIAARVKLRNEVSPFLISRIVGMMYRNEGENAPEMVIDDIEADLKKTDTSDT